MLYITGKTPTKLDDYVILFLGFALVAVPVARILGFVSIGFEYFEVLLGTVLPLLVVFGKWVYYLFKYYTKSTDTSPQLPDPVTALLFAMAIFHTLPIWEVSDAAENAVLGNAWLVLMTYFLVAAALGRYLWPVEFFRLVLGTLGLLGQNQTEGTDDTAEHMVVEPVLVSEVAAIESGVQETMPVIPATPVQVVHMPPQPPEMGQLIPRRHMDPTEQLIQGGMNGDIASLAQVLEELNRLSIDYVKSTLLQGGVYPVVVAKIEDAMMNGDVNKLKDVMTHTLFASKQKPVFLKLLSRQ